MALGQAASLDDDVDEARIVDEALQEYPTEKIPSV